MTEVEAYRDLTPLSEQEFERFADCYDGTPPAYRQFLAETGWGTLAGDNLALFQAPEFSSSLGLLAGEEHPYLVFGTDKAGYFFAFVQGSVEVYGLEASDPHPEVLAPDFPSFMKMKAAEA